MKVQFLGAAGSVTGSKTLVEADAFEGVSRRILIDCGLFQGLKELRLKNREPLGVDPASLDCVILTHAHLDHCGYLPVLVQNGFKGKIYCTAPTRELTRLVLLDAGTIQEEDSGYANQKGFSKHHPALPLFTVVDAERAIERLEIIGEDEWFTPTPGFRARLRKNGHILGSCSLILEADSKRITFSGDLGRKVSLLHSPPKPLEPTDYLVLESTYGDRNHRLSEDESEAELCEIINHTIQNKGHVLIPSFAIGRTQELLLLISRLLAKKAIPDVPVFLDSPMGARATDIYKTYPGWHKLSPGDMDQLLSITQVVEARDKSMNLSNTKLPKIIIAGSGMATGGRVLHHLTHLLPDPKTTVLFVGFQSEGTRGRDLVEGKREIKIHGKQIYVRAHIKKLDSLSAHADQRDLVDWVANCGSKPTQIFLQHGEAAARETLAAKIETDLKMKTHVPSQGEVVVL